MGETIGTNANVVLATLSCMDPMMFVEMPMVINGTKRELDKIAKVLDVIPPAGVSIIYSTTLKPRTRPWRKQRGTMDVLINGPNTHLQELVRTLRRFVNE